jgi:hypothetical protein
MPSLRPSESNLRFSSLFRRVAVISRIERISSSSQLCAHLPPAPNVEIEAASGSPEDYDDRNGYLPDFLGDDSDFLVPLPQIKNTSDLVPVERASQERPSRRDTRTSV